MNGLRMYEPPLNTFPNRQEVSWYADRLPTTLLTCGKGEVLLDSIKKFETGLRGGEVD